MNEDRIPLAGLEGDAFSRTWRRYIGWGRGELRAIKRQYHKRARQAGKRATKDVEE